MRILKILIVTGIFVVFAGSVLAKPTEGPVVGYEASGPAKVNDKKGEYAAKEFSRRKIDLELFFPLKSEVLKTDFVPIVYHYQEFRTYNNNSDEAAISLPDKMSVSAFGGAAVNHRDNYNVFGAAFRYGSLESDDPKSHMVEAVAGIDFANSIPMVETEASSLSLLLRFRHFPHGDRWLPLVYYYSAIGGGFYSDVRLPSRVIFGWDAADHEYGFFGSARFDSQNYPVFIMDEEAWTEGFVTSLFIGARKRLFSILFLEAKAGVLSETMEVYTRDHKVADYTTSYAPWFRLALQTIVHE